MHQSSVLVGSNCPLRCDVLWHFSIDIQVLSSRVHIFVTPSTQVDDNLCAWRHCGTQLLQAQLNMPCCLYGAFTCPLCLF